MNKDNIKSHSDIIVGGYKTGNLSDNNIFFSDLEKKKKLRLTFNIHDISIIDNSEILKLRLGNDLICRILKFNTTDNSVPALTFDLVDENKKTITFKADKIFFSGVGLGLFLFEYNQITQWEITVIDMMCRAFVFGDKEAFLNNIDKFNIKMSQNADWFIKNIMD